MGNGRLRISCLLLEQMIGAEGFEIIGAARDQEPAPVGTIEVIVQSPDLPEVQEGTDPPLVDCIVTEQRRTSKVVLVK